MKIPRINHCCFCIDLRTGVMILGWLGTITGIASSLILLFSIGMMATLMTGDTFNEMISKMKNSSDPTNAAVVEFFEDGGLSFIYVMLTVTLVILVISTISSIMLLIGVYKDKTRFIFQWLVLTIVWLAIDFFTRVAVLIFLDSDNKMADVLGFFIREILVIAFNLYIMLSVYSYYDMVRNAKIRRYQQTQVPVWADNPQMEKNNVYPGLPSYSQVYSKQ